MPAAWNHSAISWLSAAAPGDEEADPAAEPLADLGEHEPVEHGVLDVEQDAGAAALALGPVDGEPDLERLLEDRLLGAALGGLHGDDAGMRLLEDPRRGTHERRLHHAEVVDDLVDPAVDRGGVADRELRGQQHLAEGVRHGQPAELEVVLVEDALGLDRRSLVDPRPVPQPDTLGPPGRAGGVDQGGQLVGTDRLGGLLDHAGVLGEVGVAEGGEVVEPDHPVAVGGAVEGDDLGQVGQLGLVVLELGDLLVVLGEHDAALAVAEDVRRVLGVGGRVDGRGRTPGAHHRQVGQDPLVAGAGGDADPLLGLEPQREQPRRQPRHLGTGLGPGDRDPASSPSR